MISNVSGASYNNQAYVKPTAGKTTADYQKLKLAGNGMSLERFTELFKSDAPIEEKLSEIQEAFGEILDKEALETGIKAAKSGKSSIEEMYRNCLARSNSLTYTIDEVATRMKESQRVRCPEAFTGRNDPANLEKAAPILAKVNAGRKLTPQEKSFLREHYPDAYEYAMRAEQEAEQVKKAMDSAKSPEEAKRILMDAKMAAASSNVNGSNTSLIQMLNDLDSKKTGIGMFDIEV